MTIFMFGFLMFSMFYSAANRLKRCSQDPGLDTILGACAWSMWSQSTWRRRLVHGWTRKILEFPMWVSHIFWFLDVCFVLFCIWWHCQSQWQIIQVSHSVPVLFRMVIQLPELSEQYCLACIPYWKNKDLLVNIVVIVPGFKISISWYGQNHQPPNQPTNQKWLRDRRLS